MARASVAVSNNIAVSMVTWVWITWVLVYDIIKVMLGTIIITTLNKTEPTERKCVVLFFFFILICFHANTVL